MWSSWQCQDASLLHINANLASCQFIQRGRVSFWHSSSCTTSFSAGLLHLLLSQTERRALFHGRRVLWQFSFLSLYFYLINFIALPGQRDLNPACNLHRNASSLTLCLYLCLCLCRIQSCLGLFLPTCKALPVVACPNRRRRRRRFSTLTMTYCCYPAWRHSETEKESLSHILEPHSLSSVWWSILAWHLLHWHPAYGFVIYWCKFSSRYCLLFEGDLPMEGVKGDCMGRHLIDVYVERKCGRRWLGLPFGLYFGLTPSSRPCHCHRCQKFFFILHFFFGILETFFRWFHWHFFWRASERAHFMAFGKNVVIFLNGFFVDWTHDWVDINSYLEVSAMAANDKQCQLISNQYRLYRSFSLFRLYLNLFACLYLTFNFLSSGEENKTWKSINCHTIFCIIQGSN